MIREFTTCEIKRYSRHLTLPQVGLAGQALLRDASVLLVGAGGLGSPLALYLAAAGIGRLGIIDDDIVDETNLQRQILFGSKDVGQKKTEAAKERLHDLNPHIQIDTLTSRLTSENAIGTVAAYDVIADGSDNFPTRYLVNDACTLTGRPNVYGSISRFEGQVAVLCTPNGPCYRCLYDQPPPSHLVPSCAEGGVLGVLPGLIGTVQATEVLKLVLGIGQPLVGKLLLIDALSMEFRTLSVTKDPDCPICGTNPTFTELIDYEAFCTYPPTPSMSNQASEMTVRELKQRMDDGHIPFLLDVRKPDEYAIANLGGTLIPLDELLERIDEISSHRDDEIIVYCRSGARSARAVQLLHNAGFERAVNLKGGVLAWSNEIDPSMQKY